MKALGVAFSARKKGNCLTCTEYVLTKLEARGFETEIINSFDHEIRPCSKCDYECFAPELRGERKDCPIHDDVSKIYDKMKAAAIIVLAVPTYGGKAASLYSAFTERGQAMFRNYEEFKSTILTKIIALIVIGNVPAGGDIAYHTVVSDYLECKYPPSSILLQAAEYGQSSLRGNLIDNQKIRDRLDNLVESILKDSKSKNQES
jgi:multimeric flavodoxin WrbA